MIKPAKVCCAVLMVFALGLVMLIQSCNSVPTRVTAIMNAETLSSSSLPASTIKNNAEGTTFEGIVNNLTGDVLTVDSGGVQIAVELSSLTSIRRLDGSTGLISDLKPGVVVQINYSPTTRRVSNVNIKS